MKSRVTNPERITNKKETQNHLKACFQGSLGFFFVGMMARGKARGHHSTIGPRPIAVITPPQAVIAPLQAVITPPLSSKREKNCVHLQNLILFK